MFTELNGRNAGELNEALGRIGFRRSQSVAYRPSCIDCNACVSVRVVADRFTPSATQRKLIRRHADLEVSACKPWTTEEQYALLRKYLAQRHPGGGMAEMDEQDFADMVEQTPVRTYVIEYREPSVNGRPGKLVGACLSDQQADGMSMIYSFYDVGDGARKGLGTYIILDHIVRAARAGLAYVYLGYWVEGSATAWPTRRPSSRWSASAATAGARWTRPSRPRSFTARSPPEPPAASWSTPSCSPGLRGKQQNRCPTRFPPVIIAAALCDRRSYPDHERSLRMPAKMVAHPETLMNL